MHEYVEAYGAHEAATTLCSLSHRKSGVNSEENQPIRILKSNGNLLWCKHPDQP